MSKICFFFSITNLFFFPFFIWIKSGKHHADSLCKNVRIRSHSGPQISRIFPHSDWIRRDSKCSYSESLWSAFFSYFPAFGLNTERYSYLSVFSPNAGKCGKMWTRTTPNTDTFYLVIRSLSVVYSLRLYFQFFKEPHHTQGRSFLLNCIG